MTATVADLPPFLETAVPTLKVMRLHKPDLHLLAAGTLQTSHSLMGAAMCLPDSFGVIHVGETFTAYLGALNVSKTLNVDNLTVTAQLQTPSQRWHLQSSLDEGNLTGGVQLPPSQGVDAIVSHALEEPGQHILRVEVGYSSGDGITKTIRKFYRFQVSNPLAIEQNTFRSDQNSCFVSIALSNNGDEVRGGLTISEAYLQAAPGLKACSVSEQTTKLETKATTALSSTSMLDCCGRLEVGQTTRYLFKVTSEKATEEGKSLTTGDELGKFIFKWRKACGEAGMMASSPILAPSFTPITVSNSNPVMLGGPQIAIR